MFLSCSNNFEFKDAKGEFLALVIGEAREFVAGHLKRMTDVLETLDPDSFEAMDSYIQGYSFDSIHCDTYNRFAEKVFSFYFISYFIRVDHIHVI